MNMDHDFYELVTLITSDMLQVHYIIMVVSLVKYSVWIGLVIGLESLVWDYNINNIRTVASPLHNYGGVFSKKIQYELG